MAVPRRAVRPRRRLVTLASDAGAAYAAQMKAVLARSLDPGQVVDLDQELPAHGVREAAFLVRAMAFGFPPGTIHVVVVDPGVGGRRVPVVIACRDGSLLVGPDNGVLAPLAETLGVARAYRIVPERAGVSRDRVGTTFDGRDLFAPVAARLAEGMRASSVGPSVRPRVLRLPKARREHGGALGEILHVDHFGNLISNVPSAWVPNRTLRLAARLGTGARRSLPWAPSYEALRRRRVGALGSSFGTVEIAVSLGRAADRFRARVGTRLALTWSARRGG